MSKREKIIVSLMIASVAFGAYYFLFRPDIRRHLPGGKTVEKAKRTLPDIVLSEKELHILKQAAIPWENDPFVIRKSSEVRQMKTFPPVPKDLRYSGYLRMENRMLAIINGTEYQVGDMLPQSQYLVTDISPKQITIALPGGANPLTVLLPEPE